MKNHLLLSLAALALLSACSPASVDMKSRPSMEQPPPAPEVVIRQKAPAPAPIIKKDEIKWVTIDGGERGIDFNPQIDILFVVDDSDSMKAHQENLSRNIKHFVSGLQNNKMIDYHIGVVSVWDSSDRAEEARQKKTAAGQRVFANGELRPVKSTDGKLSKTRFVYRFENNENILASTLNIGVTPFKDGGPENEEVFSPIEAALKKTGRGDTNEGFFRPEAQLVVVVVTDADDDISVTKNIISPDQMARTLIDFKGGRKEKVSVYGALVSKSDNDKDKDWALRIHPKYHPECFTANKSNGQCKGGFGPERLEQFIAEANKGQGDAKKIRENFFMSLTQKDFSKDLLRIGSDITVRALAKEVPIQIQPRRADGGKWMIEVFYGLPGDEASQVKIPQQAKGGFVYNEDRGSILLSGDIKYKYVKGAVFTIRVAVENLIP